jgi:hypothetical protein
MKSKKIKKVVLKNPCLRNLRKNLRIVLQLAYDEKSKWYNDQKRKIKKNTGFDYDKYRPLLDEFEKEWDPIMKEYADATLYSPLGCLNRGYGCMTYRDLREQKSKGQNEPESLTLEEIMDVDLVWIDVDRWKGWYCVKCYQALVEEVDSEKFAINYARGYHKIIKREYRERLKREIRGEPVIRAQLKNPPDFYYIITQHQLTSEILKNLQVKKVFDNEGYEISLDGELFGKFKIISKKNGNTRALIELGVYDTEIPDGWLDGIKVGEKWFHNAFLTDKCGHLLSSQFFDPNALKFVLKNNNWLKSERKSRASLLNSFDLLYESYLDGLF